MIIELNVFYKYFFNKIVWVAEIIAMKDGKNIKEKVLKNFSNLEDIENSLEEIKENFKNLNCNILFRTNISIKEEILKKHFSNINIEELNIDLEDKYKEYFIEMDTLEDNPNVPLYINFLPESDFERNLLLFRIAMYFEENKEKIFEFPLFLEMKKNKKIEEYVLVEEFIEDILEKSFFILNKE